MKKLALGLIVLMASAGGAFAESPKAEMKSNESSMVSQKTSTTSEQSPSVQQCTTVTKEQIASLFDRWNASLQTKSPEKVAQNYALDAVLLPTVSNKVRTNHAEIQDYFEHFLQKSPVGKIDTRTIKLGCNDAIDTGTYTFTLTDKGETKKVSARYTFTYQLMKDGQWLISSHHSSAMPEKMEQKGS